VIENNYQRIAKLAIQRRGSSSLSKKLLLALMRVMAIVGQIALVKLYTHYLRADQLGHYFFYQSISYFMNALVFVPVDYFQQAEAFRLKDEGYSLSSLYRMNGRIIAVVLSAGLLICSSFFYINRSEILPLIVALFMSISLYGSTAVKNFLNNQGDQLLVVSLLFLEVPLKFIMFWGFIRFGWVSATTPLISSVIALGLIAAFTFIRVQHHARKYQSRIKETDYKHLMQICFPTSLASIMNWLQTQGYRLVLVPLGFAELVGIFATVSAIGNSGMNGAGNVYQQIYLPRIYQTGGKYLPKYLMNLCAMILFVLIVGLALRKQIILLVTNSRFVPYGWLIAYGILLEAGNFAISALVVKMSIKNDTKAQIAANILATIAVPVVFLLLFVLHIVSIYTLGIPLVAAQVLVVGYLFFRMEISQWKQLKQEPSVAQSRL